MARQAQASPGLGRSRHHACRGRAELGLLQTAKSGPPAPGHELGPGIHSSFHVEDLLTRPWSDPIGQKLASHLHLLSSMVLALSLWETFKTVFPEGF